MRAVENSSGLSGPIVVTNVASNPWNRGPRANITTAQHMMTKRVVSEVARAPRANFWPGYEEAEPRTMLHGLGALGSVSDQWFGRIGCAELSIVLSRAEEVLRQAQSASVDTNFPAYRRLKEIVDAESGFFTRTIAVTPASCTTGVAEVQTLINALNSELARRGVANPLSNQPDVKAPGIDDYMGVIKTVAIAAAVVAGAVTVAPIIFELVGLSKTLRRG